MSNKKQSDLSRFYSELKEMFGDVEPAEMIRRITAVSNPPILLTLAIDRKDGKVAIVTNLSQEPGAKFNEIGLLVESLETVEKQYRKFQMELLLSISQANPQAVAPPVNEGV